MTEDDIPLAKFDESTIPLVGGSASYGPRTQDNPFLEDSIPIAMGTMRQTLGDTPQSLLDRISSRAATSSTPWVQPTMGPGPEPMGLADRVGRAIRESASFVVGKTPEQVMREAQAIRELSSDARPMSEAERKRRYTTLIPNEDGTFTETVNPDRTKSPLISGIERGADQMQDAAYGLAQWAATIAGMDTPTLDEWRKANQKEIQDNPSVSPGAAYALQRGGVGDMATFALESAAEALPQGIPSMGAGAVAGRLATSAAAKATMQAAGAALPNIGQAIGGIFGDAVDSGTRDREAALVAAKYGIASGLLDTIGDVLFLNKAGAGMDTALKRKLTADILNTPSGAAMVKAGVKTMGAEGFKQALSEGSTEMLQTALEQSAKIATDDRGLENYWTSWAGKMMSRENEAERFQAGAAGAFGGAGMGMASTVPEVAGKFLQMSAGTRALNEINEILNEGKMGTPKDPGPVPGSTQAPPVPPVVPTGMTPADLAAKQVTSLATGAGGRVLGNLETEESIPVADVTRLIEPAAGNVPARPSPVTPSVPLLPFTPEVQRAIDEVDRRVTAEASGAPVVSGDTARQEMHAAALNAMRMLDNRILSGIETGIPDTVIDGILAQRERIAAWEENNRPPGTTGAAVAAALAQARPAPQISVPGASGAATTEAQPAVPVPLAPVAVSPAGIVKPPALPEPSAKPSTSPEPYSVQALQGAFNLTPEQAVATDALVKSIGIPQGKISIASGGQAGPNALPQMEGILSGREPVPQVGKIDEIFAFIKKYAKSVPVVQKGINLLTSKGRASAVDSIARHTLAELNEWRKVASDYVPFYTADILERTNPTIQRYAAERYGRKLTPSEVSFIHLLSAFGSGQAEPTVDTITGLRVFDEYMRTGQATGYTNNPKPVYRAPSKGQSPQRVFVDSRTGEDTFERKGNAPKFDNERKAQISKTYNVSGLERFNKVLTHFGNDLDKTISWLGSKHSFASIREVIGDDAADSLKPHEYLNKNGTTFGAFTLGNNPKLGSYILNRWQNLGTITKDMWVARTMSRYFREPITGVPWANTADGNNKRRILDEAWGIVAEQLKVAPAQVQEMMWDAEKRIYSRFGLANEGAYTSQGVEMEIARRAKDNAKAMGSKGAQSSGAGALNQGKKGAVEFTEDGKAIIRGFESADVSTGIHELAHVARRQLFDRSVPVDRRAGITDDDIDTAEFWAGALDGIWTRDAEEKFARGFERYLRDGKSPTSSLDPVFSKFKKWLVGIYKKLTGSDVDINISPAMRRVFDRLVTRSERIGGVAREPSVSSPPSDVEKAIARQSGQPVPEGAPVKLTVSRADREKNKRALIAEKKRAGEIKKELTDAELKRDSGRKLVAASVPLRKAVDDYVEAASGIIDFKAPTDAMAQEAMRDKLIDTLYTYIGNRGQDAFRQNEAREPVFDGGKFALNKILQDGLVSYLKSKKAATSTGQAVSFDQEVGEDGGATVAEMVADPNAPDPTAEQTKKLAPIRAEIVQFVADKLLGGKVATADELELIASGVKLILNKEMYAQLGGVDVNKRSTSKGLLAWVDENKEDVLDALKEYLPWATKSKGIGPRELMSMIKEEFTDPGINLTGDGDGMFVEDVNDAIAGMLGSIPDYIRVANDPLLVNSAGEPIKGVFIGRPGGEVSITINAANHTNMLDVAITLLHEAIHAVWDSPIVQAAVSRLEMALSKELPGYSPEQIREELITRATTERWANQQQRSLWRKLVDAIYAAIRRTFGMKPTDQQLMDIIAVEGIRFLKGEIKSNRVTMRLSTGRPKRGAPQQVYINKKQVDDAKAVPGLSPEQIHGIDVVAQAIVALVPKFFVDQMERALARRIDPAWPAASRSLAKAQRSAARLLRGITDIGKLASVPVNVAGIAVEDKFVAAASVLEVKERISHRKATLQRMLDKVTAKLTAAQTQASRITKLNAKVAAADALTRTLVDSMEESLAAQEKLAPSLSAKEKASVDALKKTLGLIKFNAPARVGPALQSIAAVMPPGADPVRFLRVQQATGWPAWGSPATAPMDGTVFDFLAGSMPITGASAAPLTGFGLWTPGALEGRTDAIERIRKLQVDQVHAQQVVDNVAALFKSLGAIGIKKPTLTSFTRLYSALRKKRSAAFEQASDLSSDIRKATESLDAVSAAMNMLDAIEAHGSHRAQVRRAAGLMDSARKRLGDAESEIIQDYKDGGWIVTDPITRKTRTFKLSIDPDKLKENGRNADELLRNIDAYVTAGDTDPSTAETYRRMVPALRNIWLANANIASLTGRVQRVAFSKEWFVNLVPELAGFALRGPNLVKETMDRIVGNITGNVIGRDLIYQYLGQPIGQILNRYMARTDWMDNVIRSAMDNPTFGSGVNKIALFRRVNQLAVSLDLPYGQAISVYAHDVLDHIYAMGGNMGGMQAYVGMRSPGGTILTADDFAIARMGKLYNDYLLTQMRKKSEGVLSEVSLQTEDEAYFRNAVDWGWKMKRRRSRWGHEFLSQWDEALKKDVATGVAGFSDNRMALLDNAENFVNAVNKTVATTDPTWKSSDKVQAEAMLARLAMPDWTFQTMADFLDWMANERAAIINRAAGAVTTTYAEQRVLAEQVLLKDLDTAVKRLMDAETKDTDSESRVAGMGEATITALGGRSSFTEPRPPMAAPNGFYSYSIALDEDRLMLNAAAKRVFQVMELHALQNVITALDQEWETLDRKRREYITSKPTVWRWSSRREFAKQEVRNVLAGKATTTLRALTRVMTHLRAAEKGMTQAIQQARVEEGAALRVARTAEATMTVLKLLSPTVGFTNFLSSVFISPMLSAMARNRSKYAILSGLMSITRSTYHLSKNLMEWTTNMVAGNRPMKAWLNKHRTAWGGVADYLLNVIKRREDDIDYLSKIGIQQPPPFKEQAGRWFYETFPLGKTGGTVTEREGSWSEGIFRWALSPFSFGTVLAGMFNAKTDFTGLRVQLGMHKAMLETLRADAITAFDMRKRSDPVNYASMPIRPFTPEEIGEKNLNGLNWLRDLFSPAGGLEAVLLDFYQRAEKARSPLNIPLMNDNVERDVMMHIMGKGNIVNDSGKGEGLKGRGWGGLARTFAGRFYQYGAMFSGTLGQALHNDIRMSTGQNFAHAVGVFSIIAALTVIAGLNLAGGQELTELVKGKVANAPSMAALMQDEGWVAAMKIFILGGANLYVPTAGDLISSTITGSQPKNILDLGSMIPGLGVATSGYKWAQSVLQTGDLYYPTIALLKQNHPLVEPIFNRVPGLGAQDLPLINAARSYRSAAPSSMEIRQPGGNYRMSPDTVLVRDALRAAALNDKEEFDGVIQRAMDQATEAGKDPLAARSKILSSVKSKTPERSVFGRKLTDEERAEVMARMNSSQADSVAKAGEITARIGSWIKSAPGGLSKRKPKTYGRSRRGGTRYKRFLGARKKSPKKRGLPSVRV